MGRRFSFCGRAACTALCLALLSACKIPSINIGATKPILTSAAAAKAKPFPADRLQGMSCTALLVRLDQAQRDLASLERGSGGAAEAGRLKGEVYAIRQYRTDNC